MTALLSKLRTEIEQNGAISFARFMELALYASDLGYYERPREIGKRGDFFTSVSVGPLFGELLAFQFAEWLSEPGTGNAERGKLRIVEAGAHDGQLAMDILHGLKKFQPEIFAELEYCILEPSPRRREWQQKTLAEFPDKISWCADWSDFPRSAFSVPRFTIVFSNELFDAMPAHRLGWDAQIKKWFEWGVGLAETDLSWQRLPKISPHARDFLPILSAELMSVLPDGFTTEVCPAAVSWWKTAVQLLDAGKIMAIDYGLSADEFFVPERSRGTLRAFSHHHQGSNVLACPGDQDITAHVNFTALQHAGEQAGARTDALIAQNKFLIGVGARIWDSPQHVPPWDAAQRRQFQTLTHPEHLGRNFRVLVQSRGPDALPK